MDDFKFDVHAKNILTINYKIEKINKVAIVYDNQTELSKFLKAGFEKACEKIGCVFESFDFYTYDCNEISDLVLNKFEKDDVVVLIQSSSFRVTKYRWRNELCNRGLKVVEFGHLQKVKKEEYQVFANSLTLDYVHYKNVSTYLISLLEKSENIKIVSSNGSILEYTGKMDKCLRNIGAIWEQPNYATRFPVGEVITEALDLHTLNGEMLVYAYPSMSTQETIFCKPFLCKIKNGFLISHNGDEDFDKIYEMIKTENENGDVYVREFGLGLNRNIKNGEKLNEPLAYERQEGIHFSLGMKHGMYQKKLWKDFGKKFYQRYHIDVFVDVFEVLIDGVKVYEKGKGFLMNS